MNHERSLTPEVLMLPYLPFYFNPESREFILGFSASQKRIPLNDLNDVWEIGRKTEDLLTSENPETSETLAVVPYGPLIQMGSSREAVRKIVENKNKEEKFKEEIINIMKSVYKQISPEIIFAPTRKSSSGFLNFSVSNFPNGTFILHTFGNCACLGPVYPQRCVHASEQDSSTKLSVPHELGLHNADTKAQRLSLYAGAGAIGWFTKQK